MSARTAAMSAEHDELLSDDRVWERTWERMLNPVERHDIAKAVLRRRVPDAPFEARVGMELARRWRRQARNQFLLWALWALFWGAIAVYDWQETGAFTTLLAPVAATLGVLAMVACVAFRRRLKPLSTLRPPAPGG